MDRSPVLVKVWGRILRHQMTPYSDFRVIFRLKHVRCNPDVAPRLTSGGYEDKVDVITPINIVCRGGGEF